MSRRLPGNDNFPGNFLGFGILIGFSIARRRITQESEFPSSGITRETLLVICKEYSSCPVGMLAMRLFYQQQFDLVSRTFFKSLVKQRNRERMLAKLEKKSGFHNNNKRGGKSKMVMFSSCAMFDQNFVFSRKNVKHGKNTVFFGCF